MDYAIVFGIVLVVVGVLVELLALHVKRRQIATQGTFWLLFASGFIILYVGVITLI